MADLPKPHFSGDINANETTSALSFPTGAVQTLKKNSRQGSKSSSIRSSSTRMKQIESDQARKLAELKREYAVKMKHVHMTQLQLQKLHGDLESIQELKNSPDWTKDLERDERKLVRDIRQCEYDLGTQNAEVKFMEETMEADINVIRADAELEKEMALSDEEYASLSEEEEDKGKTEMVENWKAGTEKARLDSTAEPKDRPYYDKNGAHVYPVSYVEKTSKENQRHNDELMRQQMSRESVNATLSKDAQLHNTFGEEITPPRDQHLQSFQAKHQQNFQAHGQQGFQTNQQQGFQTNQQQGFQTNQQQGFQAYQQQGYQAHRQQSFQPRYQNYYRNPSQQTPERSGTQSGNGSADVVTQLVTALGAAFGGGHRDVVVRSGADKELPKFNGNPANWENFRSEYNRTTQKYKIDNSENLTRLRRSLEGQALTTVEHLLSTPNNIDQIWKSLEQRFGRPEFILEYLIAKAKGTRPPEENKPETVIAFGTAIEALVTNICSYNQMDYLENRQLVNEFTSKLSGSMKISWYEWLSDDAARKPTLQCFSQWLKRKVNAAILSVKPTVFTNDHEEKRSKRGPGAVHVSSGEEKSDMKECLYCEKSKHTIPSCWKFKKIPLSERWEKVKQLKLCVCCLEKGHRSRSCKEKKECSQPNCTYLHHPLLHSDKPINKLVNDLPREDAKEIIEDKSNSDKNDGAFSLVQGCDGPLAIIPVRVKGPNGIRKVHVFLDNGASRSMITKKLAKELGIHGKRTEYSYRGITGNKVSVTDSEKVQFEVSGVFRGATFHNLYAAVTVDQIPLKPYSIDIDEIKRNYPHLRRAKCQNLEKIVPEVIVGNNNPLLWLARETLAGNDGEPVAWRSVLGWTISGNMDNLISGGSINMLLGESSDDYLHNLIKQNFFLDSHGVMVPRSNGINPEEKRAYAILEATTKKVADKWETGLLWREDDVKLPDSEREAFHRLINQEKRMQKDPELKMMHCAKFDEYKSKGYIQKLTPAEAAVKTNKTNYISHFGVTNVNKPGKLRLVFNAAAKINGVSLNDKLLTGPDLIRPLAAVLWNFRKYPYAITGDIADMFHRVGVREEDQDSQRFLWRDADDRRDPEHYKMVVLIFGATSSPSSAIYVKNENARTFQIEYPEASDAIINSFYVDDCLHSAKTKEDAIKIRKEINMINEAGGFTVCKWMSNSPSVLASIPEHLRADGIKNLNEKNALPTERVLGSWWDPNLDVMTFKVNFHKVSQEILDGKQPTKREVSRLVMSIFDPLGIVNHYKIKGLIILQNIWRTGIGWDDEVPADIYDHWKEWLAMLHDITKVRVPRMYTRFLDDHDSLEIHTFVDSSEEGYCAVSYLRAQKAEEVEVAFISSKVRVASLKKQTIPRLELQAALLGSRLANSLQDELKLSLTGRTFWSDSKTVLLWIRANAIKYKEFVANRVGEIQETTDVAEWKWVPTALNVADLATRFTSEIGFTNDCLWFTGPEFLQCDQSSFPKERDPHDGFVAMAAEDLESDNDTKVTGLFKIQRFSSYLRCLRAIAAFQRMIKFWLWKALRKGSEAQSPWKMEGNRKISSLTTEDIVKAEISLIKQVQQEEFPEEWNTLVNGKVLKKNCKLYKLSPVIHEGIIRIRSRIMGAPDLDMDVRMPIVLPSRHTFTDLLVDHEHAANAHQGVETVHSNLRQRFWILDGRQTVKRSWSRCLQCKQKTVKPIIPEMGELPHYRLASHRLPFTFTGLDLFGPIEVTVGRRREKRWGVIMCCMVTRAVHLEVVHNLSTDEIIMALSRFVDTRGRPQMIVSDNGTNFVGASNEMKRELQKVDFTTVAANGKFHPIQWQFNPPRAPHFGGAWERLIQTVKKCMYTLLKEKHPRDTTFLTTLKAIENIMNSRPLTYVSSDPDDPQALTPNHLLRGGSDSGPAIPASVEKGDEFLRSQWRRAQLFADQFWARWVKEYLPKLQRREKWFESNEPLAKGDLVFVVGENEPRNVWKRGVITDVFPGADGQVRVVEVTVADSGGKKTCQRPVTKVCPLGLRMGMQG